MRAKSTKCSRSGLRYPGEGLAAIGGGLPGTADQIQVAIKDARGRIVRTVTMGKTATGEGPFQVEGKTDNNTALPAGIYSFSVNVLKGDGAGV